MHRSFIAIPLLAALAAPAAARQTTPAPVELGKETSIPFIDTIGFYDFQPDGDRGVWLQDQRRQWYYARISGVCPKLPFVNRIGVDTRFGGSSFDRTGALFVNGDICRIDSLVTSAGPPRKAKKSKRG